MEGQSVYKTVLKPNFGTISAWRVAKDKVVAQLLVGPYYPEVCAQELR